MMSSRIELNEDLMQATFHHFDTTNSGSVSTADFRQLLGDTFEGVPVEDLLAEAPSQDLEYAEFSQYALACVPKPTRTGAMEDCTPSRRNFVPNFVRALQARCKPAVFLPTSSQSSLPTLLPIVAEGSPPNRPHATKAAQVARGETGDLAVVPP